MKTQIFNAQMDVVENFICNNAVYFYIYDGEQIFKVYMGLSNGVLANVPYKVLRTFARRSDEGWQKMSFEETRKFWIQKSTVKKVEKDRWVATILFKNPEFALGALAA